MGRPLDIAPLACIPTTAGTGSEVSMAAVVKDHEEKVKLEIADFPLFPRLAILDPETTRTLPRAGRRRHRHGRDDARDRGLRVDRLEPAPGRALAAGAADDPRQPRARGRARRGGRGGARQHADRRQPRDHDRARLGARDVAPGRRPLRRAARRGERDPPAARDPLQRRGRRRHRRPLPRHRRAASTSTAARRSATRSPPTSPAWSRGSGCRRGCRRSACRRTASRRSWRARWATAPRCSTRASWARRTTRRSTGRLSSERTAARGGPSPSRRACAGAGVRAAAT